MGMFRFYNFNTVCRTYISRIHCYNDKNVYLYTRNRIIQSLCSSHLYEHHPFVPPDSPNWLKISKRWHGGHSHHHHHHHDHSSKEGENIFRLGLAADIGLATGKALTGYLSGSTAIIADAAHSISDVVTSVSNSSLELLTHFLDIIVE